MRDYSRSYSKIQGSVLDATLEYELKAHNVYSRALRGCLERNPKSFAREKVQKLIADYPEREKESLQRYYKRACRELNDRSVGSSSRLSRPGSPAQSGVSVLSSRTLEERQHMARLKQQVNVRSARPDLLLRWIDATIVGQARRYIRNALLEGSMHSIERRVKSVGRHRETLLNLRADTRNLEDVAQSLDSKSALRKPEKS